MERACAGPVLDLAIQFYNSASRPATRRHGGAAQAGTDGVVRHGRLLAHVVQTRAALAVLDFVAGCAGTGCRAEIDAEQVAGQSERGIDYLKREQQKDGSWSDSARAAGGISGLCTLALLTAGEPLDDPQRAAGDRHMYADQRLGQTYSVALQTMVLCTAEPLKDLLLIRDNVHWLETNQLTKATRREPGATADRKPQRPRDNSNSQFALLALAPGRTCRRHGQGRNLAARAGLLAAHAKFRRLVGLHGRHSTAPAA